MLEDKTYRIWTKAFDEGSYYLGSWDKGSEIRFLATDPSGKLQGMYSKIKENIPYQFISIEHLGAIVNGQIDVTSDEVKAWAPSLENYTLAETGRGTELKVDIEVVEDYKPMFEGMWPRALTALKELCEK
jgi:hypothetical protein